MKIIKPIIFLILFMEFSILSGLNIDSLMVELHHQVDEKRLEIYDQLVEYFKSHNQDKLISFLEEIYKDSSVNDDPLLFLYISYDLANGYMDSGENRKALEICKIGHDLAVKHNVDYMILDFVALFGNIYLEMNSRLEALKNFYEAERLSLEFGQTGVLTTIYNNIGLIYSQIGDDEKALEYYLKTLELHQQDNDKVGISTIMSNIGVIYDRLGDKELSIEFYQNAYDISEEIGDSLGMAIGLGNIGAVYEGMGLYGKSRDAINRSLIISKKINDKYGVAFSYEFLSLIEAKQDNFKLALKYIENSEIVAEKLNDRELLMDVYEHKSNVLARLDSFRDALIYYQAFKALSDSIAIDETNRKVREFSSKFESENYEQEIELLKKTNEIKDLTILQQKKIRNILFFITFVILILIVIIFLRSRRIHNLNILLNQQKEQLEFSFNQLHKAQDDLLELERKNSALATAVTASHEVNQPLMIIRGNLDLFIMELSEEQISEKQKEYLRRIEESFITISEIFEVYRSSENIDYDDYTDSEKMIRFNAVEEKE